MRYKNSSTAIVKYSNADKFVICSSKPELTSKVGFSALDGMFRNYFFILSISGYFSEPIVFLSSMKL